MIVTYSIICAILTAGYLALVIYLIKGWVNLKQPKINSSGLSTKVTVMIAARNEAERIHLTIDDILAQDYPKHLTEVIIVDDHSTDNTAAIIRVYADRGIKLLQLNEAEPLNSYKKKAIAKAISMSGGDLMVATDADCRMGPKWLSSVVGYYEAEQPVMISSPVIFFEEKSLFERMQTLEFSFLIGIGASFIGNKRASTCNGANLAYRKDIFYEVGGFSGIDELASGDDELLLQKIAERFPGRIGFLNQREAIVYTHAKYTLNAFLQQRRRWASKSTKYKDKKIIAVAIFMWFFNITMLVNIILGFFDVVFFKIFLAQFIIKYLIEFSFLYLICSFFKRRSLLSLLIIVAPLHMVYLAYLGLMGTTRKYDWKGRMVK
ncbi:glycosyltransferase [Mucilaginibacter sp. UR6-11]|uniref:glycosyltransferase family 2 protein n=1 Tax=Mucilaginibacter sp. UR6-11 TaxID=1435644 RepID=UPI001E43210A|nr:glycosyltransferase [Mucilaginibacter sp. UR6-11]MCC8424623.1 glycosyltransferase [Mucilaginibacter sp. UR6-11]